ncbi:alpha/beta hydrolase [Streptomyces sp. 7-21]|uniref:alpha/beta hydrolase n=1 Tax=Streptomyces sp. 7-21 TaxID=2802283 RepID=UPI00191FB436|nr:alpha/beta hydrolase [Streptomyces sp. 7-21]MBL1065549.1 alpha/beta hydrolase [Streptomyces sp. 7-21]
MRPPLTGTAAGVPFTALPPDSGGAAPLIVTWHMHAPPCSDAAFAAALPMHGLPAWRVHLGMPGCGARMAGGRMDAVRQLVRDDALRSYLDPLVRQAAAEFPAALASLRAQLPVSGGPVGVLGGSLGGAVALRVLADSDVPVFAGAVVNAAIRARSVVNLLTGGYRWDAESEAAAAALDFLARADAVGRAPLLVVSGECDYPPLRADAARLAGALGERGELLTVPGLARPLAEEPGTGPAPQLPLAREVDSALTAWFRRHLAGGG